MVEKKRIKSSKRTKIQIFKVRSLSYGLKLNVKKAKVKEEQDHVRTNGTLYCLSASGHIPSDNKQSADCTTFVTAIRKSWPLELVASRFLTENISKRKKKNQIKLKYKKNKVDITYYFFPISSSRLLLLL